MHKANIPPIATAIGVLGFIAALVFAGMQLQRNRSNEDAQVNVSTNTGRTEELAARFGGEVTYVDSNGIRLRLVEAGLGPLVILVHGWPESWYSWRHQLQRRR